MSRYTVNRTVSGGGGSSGEVESLKIPPKDLSTVSGEDDTLYYHDGTSEITLADGSTTSAVSYYVWDAGADGWRQIGLDADTVDGFHGDQIAKLSGDVFTGPLRVDTETEDALLELLTASGSQYYPTLHLGGDSDNGLRLSQQPDTDSASLSLMNGGVEETLFDYDVAAQNMNITRVRELEAGSFDADDYETAFRVYRNGNLVGYIDNSASDLRVKAFGGASAELINDANDGLEVTSGSRISFGENDMGDFPKYSDDTVPPNDTIFYDTTDAQLEYKDPSGGNHVLG